MGVKYFIEVTKFRCRDCGSTGYQRGDIHRYGLVNTRGTMSGLKVGCAAAKKRGGHARIEEFKDEELYAGSSYHGKLSDLKITRVVRDQDE